MPILETQIVLDDPHKPRTPDYYTRNLPFGRDVDTLVLCKNYRHLNEVVKAFGLKARYDLWTSMLLGHRFKKIIWLAGHGDSETEAAVIEAVIREILPTKLKPDGELFVL